jgi:2-methylcitrate dehydratase PrpD
VAEPAAQQLAAWACELKPGVDDLDLARRSLLDTVAVAYAARQDPITRVLGPLTEPGRWAALAHVLDYDDLHLPSTAHLSAVCVPAALGAGGDARAYLAGAGVMARLGTALGWRHYSAGWHATCTAGAPGAAVAGAVARGLDAERTAVAIALAIASAGGVQRAFGTAAKSLQVAAAVESGLRAAALAAAGASADIRAVEDWMRLVGGDPEAIEAAGPAVPGGLAVKVYPCCYALQRPIATLRELGKLPADSVERVRVRTPAATLTPLIHPDPKTGLEAKFSLEYGVAATLLDGVPGLESFSDAGVVRPQARRLMGRVQAPADTADGQDLLSGTVAIEVELSGGELRSAELALPPGAPQRPLSPSELRAKLAVCAPEAVDAIAEVTWDTAPGFLGGR